ncbi:hypothetical protein, partial [Parvibaculum sp.]|uniref:hypothetical protein n=1 Tax=Parvibaculum sp. TaxID=2024848 RepID=UPI003BAB2608
MKNPTIEGLILTKPNAIKILPCRQDRRTNARHLPQELARVEGRAASSLSIEKELRATEYEIAPEDVNEGDAKDGDLVRFESFRQASRHSPDSKPAFSRTLGNPRRPAQDQPHRHPRAWHPG